MDTQPIQTGTYHSQGLNHDDDDYDVTYISKLRHVIIVTVVRVTVVTLLV